MIAGVVVSFAYLRSPVPTAMRHLFGARPSGRFKRFEQTRRKQERGI